MYNRQLLLSGEKRNRVLELWEIWRYGRDSYGDTDYVSIYGLSPADWYARGVRLLGRTAVECTRDALADAIGEDVAAIATTAPHRVGTLVIDPFAGSGNTLYWILRHLTSARGLGFEIDFSVFTLTCRNLTALGIPIDVVNTDYRSGLSAASLIPGELLVVFVAPPWGDALSSTLGLDLRKTAPPVASLVDVLLDRFPANKLLVTVQIYELMNDEALVEVRERFDWSAMKLYGLNAPGQNHGILLGTKGWIPSGPEKTLTPSFPKGK